MHDALRHVAVIRKEQEPLRVAVEPANREQPGLGWQKLHYRSPVALIACRGNEARWLVHYDVSKRLAPHQFAVDVDSGAARIDPRSKLGHDLPVDRNSASLNQLLRFAPRGNSSGSEYSLQSLSGLRIPFHLRCHSLLRQPA